MLAINTDLLGPFNKELLDLSVLSYNEKSLVLIVSFLLKRLTTYMNDYYSSNKSDNLSRSKSFSLKRSSSSSSTTSSPSNKKNPKVRHDINDKQSLLILKTLTVTLYLIQYGSDSFVDWIKLKYLDFIVPLKYVKFNNNYSKSIISKSNTIITYCKNEKDLTNLRSNTNKLRLDMIVPGLKRSTSTKENSIIPSSHINDSPSFTPTRNTSNTIGNYTRSSRSLDIPRSNNIGFDSHDLSPLVEELHSQSSDQSLSNQSISNPINANSDHRSFLSNNPFS